MAEPADEKDDLIEDYASVVDKLRQKCSKMKKQIQTLEIEKRSRKPPRPNGKYLHVHFSDPGVAKRYRTQIEQFLNRTLNRDIALTFVTDGEEPEIIIEDTPTTTTEADVKKPDYSSVGSILGEQDEEQTAKDDDEVDRPKQSCFNCDGDHLLPDCPLPKDFAKIGRSRREFMNKSGSSAPKGRYHVEEDNRFSAFKPGVVSPALRAAMNLGENEIPPFIYKMRQMGYPPGWLAETEVHSSGLSMFDSQGKEVVEIGTEDGEIVPPKRYDVSMIVDFPGFNVGPPPETVDRAQLLGFLPMQPHQHKDCMVQSMMNMEFDEQSRRQSIRMPAAQVRADVDMDVEELPHIEIEVSGSGSTPTRKTDPKKKTEGSQSEPKVISPLLTPRPTSQSKKIEAGTPIVMPNLSGTPRFSTLPSPEDFQKGISDHIPYENLPNATGFFKKFSGVLQGVRKKIKDMSKN